MELTQHEQTSRTRTSEIAPRSARRRRLAVLVVLGAVVLAVATAGWFGYPALQGAWASPAPPVEAGELPTDVDTAAMVSAEPQRLVDRDDALAPGTRFRVALPEGLSAVALAISQRDPQTAGALTVDGGTGPTPVPGLDPSTDSANAIVVVPVRGETLNVLSEAGGRLTIDLVGRFAPAAQARAGRFVRIEPTEVASLDTSRDGRTVSVPVEAYGARPGTLAALVQVNATIGSTQPASVAVNPVDGGSDQALRWAPDSSGNPDRQAAALVRVGDDGRFTLDYQHGSAISVKVLGYFTGDQADPSDSGLLKPGTGASPFGDFT